MNKIALICVVTQSNYILKYKELYMSYQAKVLRVMIASPSDVSEERIIAKEVIHNWNAIHSASRNLILLPVCWEDNIAAESKPVPAQSIINKKILNDSDIVIGIFWTRLGSPTNKSSSGTVEELMEHINSGKLAMIYFSSKFTDPNKIDIKQINSLNEFKEKCSKNSGIYGIFDDTNIFRTTLFNDLQLHLNSDEFWENTKNARTKNHDKQERFMAMKRAIIEELAGQDTTEKKFGSHTLDYVANAASSHINSMNKAMKEFYIYKHMFSLAAQDRIEYIHELYGMAEEIKERCIDNPDTAEQNKFDEKLVEIFLKTKSRYNLKITEDNFKEQRVIIKILVLLSGISKCVADTVLDEIDTEVAALTM